MRFFNSKFLKFAFTGSLGFIIDFGLTWVLIEKFSVGYYLANFSGFTTAVTSNYCINKYWTFNQSSLPSIRQFSIFLIISSIGLFLNFAIIMFLNNNAGLDFYFSKISATILVVMWNFIANKHITFKVHRFF
ncbi:GtrA family protein [Sphingobacterium hungaricum]|uniref:Glycosyl transferase family 2 n=1 Tax=Sphingobacterium hungaricum TaxID=2082723 RepID=A0A928UZ86_9SPHI|nr:glycosyl transferase family 2 [Sphingobacterium hungaricum]